MEIKLEWPGPEFWEPFLNVGPAPAQATHFEECYGDVRLWAQMEVRVPYDPMFQDYRPHYRWHYWEARKNAWVRDDTISSRRFVKI